MLLTITGLAICFISWLCFARIILRIRERLRGSGIQDYLANEAHGDEFILLGLAIPVAMNGIFYGHMILNPDWGTTLAARLILRIILVTILLILTIYFYNGVLSIKLRRFLTKWKRLPMSSSE